MKETILVVIVLFFFGCNQEKVLDGRLILERTITKHDSLNSWTETKLNLHIQEPRIANPHRYSILQLNNSAGFFKLSRNRDQHISEHVIDSNGNSFVLLNGKSEIDTTLIKKYRLDASRNIGYKNFYQLLYGLPMSLNDSNNEIVSVSESIFNRENCFKIEMELKEPVISKFWNLFVSSSNMEIKGVEIIVPDKPDGGERIYFDELIIVNGIKIPRIRHWHELKSDVYSGTDVIVKELTD